jgi:hypothetical protein
MDVSEALNEAINAIQQADPPLPNDLRAPAFGEVLRHLLSSPSTAVARREEPLTPSGGGTGLARLAAKIKVPEEALADIFDIDNEDAKLHVASSRIPQLKSRATRDVALLIVAARQGAGLDDGWTPVTPVREALTHYNRYDVSNFSSNLRACGDVFNIRGRGPSTELRLTQPGWEAASTLIRSMAGTGNGS